MKHIKTYESFLNESKLNELKGVIIGDKTVTDNPGMILHETEDARLVVIPNGPGSHYGGDIY